MTPTLNAAMDHREAPRWRRKALRWRRKALRSRRTSPWRKGTWDLGGPNAAAVAAVPPAQDKVVFHVACPLWQQVEERPKPAATLRFRPTAAGFQVEPTLGGCSPKPAWPGKGTPWTPTLLVKPECFNSDCTREGSGARRLGGDPPPDRKWTLHNLSHVYSNDYSTPCLGQLCARHYGIN